jgi:hypothetical protein
MIALHVSMHAMKDSAEYIARAVSYAHKVFMKLTTVANVTKLVTAVSYAFFIISYNVCPWQALPVRSNVFG